jgi:hypothetical protein
MPYDTKVKGWMLVHELHTIEKWAIEVPDNGIIVEVGSLHGRSAVCWAMTAKPSVKIFCIDKWQGDETPTHNHSKEVCERNGFPFSKEFRNTLDKFTKNTKRFSNIIPICAQSPYEIENWNEPIDLFFLDASHRNPSDWENICFWKKFIKPGGRLCGHDYFAPNQTFTAKWPDVFENVKRLEKMLKQKAVIGNGSLWSFML